MATEHDTERWHPEVHSSRRSDFARDRARAIHASGLRRLSQKTQVVSPTLGLDFSRSRLTHSLEVAQIGREVAETLGLEADVVDTACLVHDIGHPPFGHNGEKALNIWASDIGGFEGNAQTLRVITRLEPKVVTAERSFGLNFTRASVDASCKYPWPDTREVLDPSGRVKFGFYADDVEAFEWVRAGAPLEQRCIEAEVMDLADDIAYSVHDFEDAIVNGFVDVRQLSSRMNHEELVDRMLDWVGAEFSREELVAAFDRLDDLETWLSSFDGSRRDQAGLKNLTSKLIGRFAVASVRATREHHSGQLGRFQGSMVIPREVQAEIAVLKGTVSAFVMTVPERQPIYREQRHLLIELADALLAGAPKNLDLQFAHDFEASASDELRKRAVVDQIASLTDRAAVAWHRELVG